MIKVFIKYNPYKLETEVTVNGKTPIGNLLIPKDRRLQAWVENLPEYIREYGETKAEVEFHGTALDYEDVEMVAEKERGKKDGVEIECRHIQAKEAGDKVAEINSLFEEIKDGIFVADEKASDEYKKNVKESTERVAKAFKQASDGKFEVAVIATMSSGKSTLINALLRQIIMPAKQEACTAIITRITDTDDNKSTVFKASAYDENGNPVGGTCTINNIEVMNELNGDPRVCRVEVEGNIPFVSAERSRLVLVDTPGPNTARDPEHKRKTYGMLTESTKTLVLYIMNGTQLNINDDNELLNYVAEQTRVGGKQSKDRFLFVINKLDEFRTGQDDVYGALERVKNYLKDKGIEDPNIYPASALVALNIRYLKGRRSEMDADTLGETQVKIDKFNRPSNAMLHFETMSPRIPSAEAKINKALAAARAANDAGEEALIHTGIIPIENAIKAFVEKYAESAKIKNLVDTFNKELESAEVLEVIQGKIDTDETARKQALEEIAKIEKHLANGKEARTFKDEIDNFNCDKKIDDMVKKEVARTQAALSKKLGLLSGELSVDEANHIYRDYVADANESQAALRTNLDKKLVHHFEEVASDLLEQYRKKLSDLSKEVAGTKIPIISLKDMMDGDVGVMSSSSRIVSSLTQSEDIYESSGNPNKRWWKPWTWGDAPYRSVKVGTKEYVEASALAVELTVSVEKKLKDNHKACTDYAKRQTNEIKEFFKKRFDELDKLILTKTTELKRRSTDTKNIAARIEESTRRLEWIKTIKSRVEAILEI